MPETFGSSKGANSEQRPKEEVMGGIDGKYGVITSSKKEFHPGEPLFLLRATDPLAPEAIRQYAGHCKVKGCDPEHVAAAHRHADRIEAWQDENPDLVKDLPGPSPDEQVN